MSNTNRDYAIVYDVKNSSLVLNRPLVFYITDKNTSNIFVRLVTRIIIEGGIDQYADIENATNYILTMRVIKPNDEIKSVQATQHEPESLFQFDLTEDFKDIPGKYICELIISTIVNGRQELITSDAFNYEVKRSILSKVNVIEGKDTTVEKLLNDLDATKAELSLRIDNLAKLTEGSTTGDAELIDARIGSNGIVYNNLGNAIRKQFENVLEGNLNDHSLTPLKMSFITSDAIYCKSQYQWVTNERGSYKYTDIVIDNLSIDQPVYVNIGDSDAIDKASCVAIVYGYSQGEKISSTVINSSQLNTNVILPNNGRTINKIVISLCAAFESIIEAGTVTTVKNIFVKMENSVGFKFDGVKINESDVIKSEGTVITVKADGTGDFNNPLTATNAIFSRAWNGEKITIKIYEGEYDIYSAWTEENKTGWYITGLNVGWNINAYIKLVGVGDRDKIICKCYQPDNSEYATSGSCINMNFGGEIENITFLAKNCRYTCHSDNSNYQKNLKYSVKNCVFKHFGNASGLWEYHGAWMEGSSSGNEYLFEECEFYGVRSAYGTHTNTNFELPSVHRFKNCKFFNDDSSNNTVNFESLGSGVMNKSYLEGCYIQRSIGLVENSTDVGIDMELMGHGNSRVTINNPKNAKTYFTDM